MLLLLHFHTVRGEHSSMVAAQSYIQRRGPHTGAYGMKELISIIVYQAKASALRVYRAPELTRTDTMLIHCYSCLTDPG